jgi:cobalamin biosynthesis protein CobW
MKPVAVDIVTGFLGSGKTTLLTHALTGPLARPDVVFIVNELGDIGLDGRVLTGMASAESVVELAGGCICCSVEDARFDIAVRDLVDRFDPALIVIETTGIADPSVLGQRVAMAGLGLDAVITVVDAGSFDISAETARVVRAQVAAADFVVVNKVDLSDVRSLRRVRARLRRWNRRARVFEAVRGVVDSNLLFGLGLQRYRQQPEAPVGRGHGTGHLHEDAIRAVSLRSRGVLDRKRFERFLGRLPAEVVRAKGVVSFADTPWRCVFNYTCGRYEMNWVQWPTAPAGSEAVFIGREIERAEPALAGGLAACEAAETS